MAPSWATAIKIGARYFVRFGRRGRVLTAYWLAGATLWADDDDPRLEATLRKLQRKGKSTELTTITEEVNLRNVKGCDAT